MKIYSKEKVHHKRTCKKRVTVLLVSHDLRMIEEYCNKVIWLEQGKIIKEGETKEVVREYKR